MQDQNNTPHISHSGTYQTTETFQNELNCDKWVGVKTKATLTAAKYLSAPRQNRRVCVKRCQRRKQSQNQQQDAGGYTQVGHSARLMLKLEEFIQ